MFSDDEVTKRLVKCDCPICQCHFFAKHPEDDPAHRVEAECPMCKASVAVTYLEPIPDPEVESEDLIPDCVTKPDLPSLFRLSGMDK